MTTIRKSVHHYIAEKTIPLCIDEAVKFISNKYPNVGLDVDYIFSSSYNRSRYFRNEDNVKYTKPTVCISVRPELYLYDKRSLGIKRTFLRVGERVQMTCALIHELTHHVQEEQKERIGNELDTTANELEYLRINHFDLYKQLLK